MILHLILYIFTWAKNTLLYIRADGQKDKALIIFKEKQGRLPQYV